MARRSRWFDEYNLMSKRRESALHDPGHNLDPDATIYVIDTSEQKPEDDHHEVIIT
jgi:hypothetical protein